MKPIYHLAPKSEWEEAKLLGEYWPAESANCPFIHFSFAPQVVRVANALFHGRRDLILLEVDQSKVESHLRIEASTPDGEKFPHLYRKLDPKEVTSASDFLPSTDGSFDTPPTLK